MIPLISFGSVWVSVTVKVARLLFLGAVIQSAGCAPPLPPCEKSLAELISSPREGVSAFVLDVQCGATTADSKWVLVGPKPFVEAKAERIAVFDGPLKRIWWERGELHIDHGDSKRYHEKDIISDGIAKGYRVIYHSGAEDADGRPE